MCWPKFTVANHQSQTTNHQSQIINHKSQISYIKHQSSYHSYHNTGAFSALVLDYLDDKELLRPFYAFRPNLQGIRKAMENRRNLLQNRSALKEIITRQYAHLTVSEKVRRNIDLLAQENVFTVCTAHQPNIFTGHLYFIYKILHTCILAEELNESFSEAQFVPIFYMGSEDADLDELGSVCVNGKKYKWETKQQGAVGRMKVDDLLLKMLDEIESQLSVEPFGKDAVSRLRKAYKHGATIEQATFQLVNDLFSAYGLVVILPDNPELKKIFIPVLKKELLEGFSQQCVNETLQQFPSAYKVQVKGRDLNLFYLKDDLRCRMEKVEDSFVVTGTDIRFSVGGILDELEKHPERFSPNVILRPLLQEILLPNVAFIGGGGELAYWMELKRVFEVANVPFPVLVLRNSFCIIKEKISSMIQKIGLDMEYFFKSDTEIIRLWLKKNESLNPELTHEKALLREAYQKIQNQAARIDNSLKDHSLALMHKALFRIEQLEKKMEKSMIRKHSDTSRQIQKIKSELYPDGVLQERVENYFGFHAVWGNELLHLIYEYSKGLQQEFCCIQIEP